MSGCCLLFCCCWCWALPRVVAPRLRRRKELVVTEGVINQFIEQGEARPAEDVDPEMAINPVAIANIEAKKKKALEDKRRKAKEKRAREHGTLRRGNESSGSGFIVAGAWSKLGVTVTRRKSAEKPKVPEVKGLREIDIAIARDAEAARAAAAAREADAGTSAMDRMIAEAEAAAADAKKATGKKPKHRTWV
jgi:hypothetical protein